MTFYAFENDILNILLLLLSGLYYRAVSSKVSIISELNRGIYTANILFCPTYSLCLAASGHVQNAKPKSSTFSQCFLGSMWGRVVTAKLLCGGNEQIAQAVLEHPVVCVLCVCV